VSIPIVVRLSAEVVNLLDELVDSGPARTRASVIGRALLREWRYQRMLQEVEILNLDVGSDTDLNSLARFSRNVVLNVD
jgi:Arc/MetJ-type ribon-helix-helix transcriptional regulator